MLNENIKAIRKSKGLSQQELAIKLNVVRQTISKWEQGPSQPDGGGDFSGHGKRSRRGLRHSGTPGETGRSLYGIPQRDRRAAKLWEAPMGLCRRKGGDLPGDAAVKGDEIHDGGGHEGPGAVFGRIEPVGLQGLSSIRGAFWLFRRICPRMCSSKAGRRINRGWRRRSLFYPLD